MVNLRTYLVENGVSVDGIIWPSYGQSAGSFSDIDLDISSKPLSLYVQEQYGRFGNNIHQIIHSLIIARKLSIKNIYCSFFLGEAQTKTLIIDDIVLEFGVNHKPEPPCISATMFYLQGFENFINMLNYDTVKCDAEKISRAIFPVIRSASINQNKVVVFHFRSGDIFESNINPIYTQPPLSYYIKSFKHINDTMKNFKIYVVYENNSNPCIKEFQKFLSKQNLPYENWSKTFSEDARLIISANCIVSSYSSFCDMLALMNENLERWYAFRWVAAFESIDLSLSREFSKILKSNATDIYLVRDEKAQYTALGGWKFTGEQIDNLLNYPISNLSIERL